MKKVWVMACLAALASHAAAGRLIDERTASNTLPSGSAQHFREGTAGAEGFVLKGSSRLSEQLRRLLQTNGWTLVWEPSSDWALPADVVVSGDLMTAMDQVSKWLTSEGRPLQFVAYEGNRVLVVKSLEVLKQ